VRDDPTAEAAKNTKTKKPNESACRITKLPHDHYLQSAPAKSQREDHRLMAERRMVALHEQAQTINQLSFRDCPVAAVN
jgi:hypothetical protein